MPLTRPEAISDLIRLAYEVRAAMRGFVAEDGAVDSLLPAVVDELSPDEHRVSAFSSEYHLSPRAREKSGPASVAVSVPGIVALIEFEAVKVAILCEPPEGLHSQSCSLLVMHIPGDAREFVGRGDNHLAMVDIILATHKRNDGAHVAEFT
jgi:hypothetical protein